MTKTLQGLVVGLIVLGGLALMGGDHGSSLWPFVGRFHPLLVHLPIGILILALIAEGIGQRHLVRFALLLGAWSAIAAGAAGVLLADWGSYDPVLLLWHRGLGLVIPVLAVLTYWLNSRRGDREPQSRRHYQLSAGSLLVAVIIGGHLGGSLSRGAGYLTRHLPASLRMVAGLPGEEEITRLAVGNPDTTPVYGALIQPILTARCGSCHNADRKKGGLVLTNAAGLVAGGRQGKVIVPGRADESELLIRLSLPPGHTDAMPPDHSIPIAEAELLRWWIDQGASTDVMLSAIERPASVRRTLAAYGLDDLPMGIFALPLRAADTAAVAQARRTGLIVQPLAGSVSYLSISAASLPSGWGGAELESLRSLAANVAWVDLARTAVGDSALALLGTMKHLTRLRLSQTRVTDIGLEQLRQLSYLEYLNLVDTDVTDRGLRALEGLSRLRAIYLWGTHATQGGVARLRRALPRATIALGAPALAADPAPSPTVAPPR